MAVKVCAAGKQAGTWAAGANTECTDCASGKFKIAAGNGANACVAHKECPAGEEPSPIGSATMDTTCVACVAGTFKAAAGSAACKAHKTCGVGETAAGGVAGISGASGSPAPSGFACVAMA